MCQGLSPSRHLESGVDPGNEVDTWHVAKEQDLGTRSGFHSNVPEINAVLFLTFKIIYLLFHLFRSFRLFRWFRFVVLVFSTCPHRFYR